MKGKRKSNIERSDPTRPSFGLEMWAVMSSGLIISIKRRRTSYDKKRAP
jgi:hypothetical protein